MTHSVVSVEIGASGIIFAFVVVLWAMYVLPLALRRYDESERHLQVGALGSFSRIIGRSSAGDKKPEIAVDVSKPKGERIVEVEPKVSIAEKVAKVADVAKGQKYDRPAARRAAQRRRRVLYLTVFTVLITGAFAAVAVVPVWSVGPAVALVVAWLVVCRFQVRIEQHLTRGARAGATAADREETIVISHQFEDIEPDRPHVMETDAVLEADALEEKLEIAVPSVASNGSIQWDPLPVTLPTYVSKPRVGRTVRTIDFDQPGTWTSGHVEGEQTELPLEAEAEGNDRPEAVGH